MKTTDILYIEDNEDYIRFVRRAIDKVDEALSFGAVMDGREAMEMLDNNSSMKTLPRLILLDLNLPDADGFELLANIRTNKATRYIPVVMFSSSDNEGDMKKALDKGANAYLVKPNGLAPLARTIQSVYDFWLGQHRSVENFAA